MHISSPCSHIMDDICSSKKHHFNLGQFNLIFSLLSYRNYDTVTVILFLALVLFVNVENFNYTVINPDQRLLLLCPLV